MDTLVRNLHIDLIMDNPNPIIDIFNGICDELSVVELNVYHKEGGEFIYYDKNNEWVFFMDISDGVFYCSKTRYWNIIESQITTNYNFIRIITKIMIENKLNNTIIKIEYEYDPSFIQVVKTLNYFMRGIILK